MRTFSIRTCGFRVILALIVGFGFSSSAIAGEVYSWTTDSGTHSFTNDQKRIPSRYKSSVERKTVGSLKSYDRFTPGPEAGDGDYSKRLESRLSDLRDRADRQDERMGSRHHRRGHRGSGAMLDWRNGSGRGDSFGLALPISRFDDGYGVGEGGPMIVRNVRLPKQGGDQSTHHATIVTKNGRVVAVFEAERNNRPLP